MVIKRFHAFIGKSGAGKVALNDPKVFAEPIELAQMPLDRQALVLRHELLTQPGAYPWRRHRSACGQDGIKWAMEDRLDDCSLTAIVWRTI